MSSLNTENSSKKVKNERDIPELISYISHIYKTLNPREIKNILAKDYSIIVSEDYINRIISVDVCMLEAELLYKYYFG